ncbi:GMC family oxidoreductase [Actinomadura barringtoniae]|uniref:GMC family oxidoreductase n=1 Tax=Actinomadura barringtoniae TaxID=1427535 RepID=A0A939PBA7_9ACTN|nr:GMC family oxidoreductase N-terminal domain-containing protein [Actinomadura barringtoniae]MBO2449435.1 GMC family oxidoreductase [Actinomadura barringtoniae]
MRSVLSPAEAAVLADLCELVVPGSSAIGPELYIELAIAGMPQRTEDDLHAAIGLLASITRPEALAPLTATAAFGLVRRLAIEAYYGGFAAPDHSGPTGWDEIDFNAPQARRLARDWSFLAEPEPASDPLPDTVGTVVVGSGAGGGLVAAELGKNGHDVLVIEAGGLHQASEHTRFELEARHRLWWPARFADTGEDDEPVALLAGRCVGGSTVINTKVAMRAAPSDLARFRAQTGLAEDLDPWYGLVERWLGVRERADWTPSVHRLREGLRTLGASLEPVRSYTDHNCTRCGSCLQGCPTNAGKSALNTFITPALGRGEIRLATRVTAESLLIEDGAVTGVVCRTSRGRETVRTRTVVLAAGTLNTPRILLSSPGFDRPVGRTLGLHPARLVYGRFDEPQDCHRVYPITAHCLDRQEDFVLEGTTIQDPVSFAESLVDEAGRPLWGERLAAAARAYRHWAGVLVMAGDENTGVIEPALDGGSIVTKRFSRAERDRMDEGLAFASAALRAAGAREVIWTGLSTTHMQGSVPMGEDTVRSAVDSWGRSHDVAGLHVADGSVIPASMSVNPSLTIMALAARVAAGLVREHAEASRTGVRR